MTYDFGGDVAGAALILQYKERTWPYQSHQHDALAPGQWTEADSEIDDSSLASGELTILLPAGTIKQWQDRMLELQLIIEHDGRTWVAADFTVNVQQGA